MTIINSLYPEGVRAVSFLVTAYENARLDEAGVRQLNDRGYELQSLATEIIIELSGPCPNDPLLSWSKNLTKYDNNHEVFHAPDFLKRAYDNAKLGEIEAQQLNDRGSELRSRITELVIKLSHPRPDNEKSIWDHEQGKSDYRYSKIYKGPKSIHWQINAIAEIYNLDPTQALEYAKNLPADPKGMEGWFAIPSVEAIARNNFPHLINDSEKYCQAVQFMLDKLSESRPLFNWHEDKILPSYLRVSARTLSLENAITLQQSGDILIIAAQLGLRHRNRSNRLARDLFRENEFGLTSLAVGSILLTHPELIMKWADLDIVCLGDEFNYDNTDRPFSSSLSFGYCDAKHKLALSYSHGNIDKQGGSSGFVPII